MVRPLILAIALSLCACARGSGGGKPVDAGGEVVDLSDEDSFFFGGVVIDGGLMGCATDTQKATLKPLDIYFMVDTSASMSQLTQGAGSPSKWDAIRQAMSQFLNDPQSAGIGVGLQFFPITVPNTTPQMCNSDANCGGLAPCIDNKACVQNGPVKFCQSNADCGGVTCAPVGVCSHDPTAACFGNGGGCGSCLFGALSYCSGRDSCMAADYGNPAVAIAPLPAAASAMTTALTNKMPDGLTPTAAALHGAVDRATTQANANPDHVVVAVLATDGFPTECTPQDIPSIAQIAANALPKVKTFVIGVFTPAEQTQATQNLNQIASAGGTSSAFVISTASDVAQQFLTALGTIRGSSLPCEYKLPIPTSGTPDYGLVNVEFTTGGVTYLIPYAKDAASCDPQRGGWYYDVAPSQGTPQKVELCPSSCSAVKSDATGQIDVVQGCATVIL